MNQTHTFIGNVVAEPDVRMAGEAPVAEFRLAVDDRYRDGKTGEWKSRPTQFWNVQAWRGLAEAIQAQLAKGQQVVVVGEIRRDEWKDEAENKTKGRNFVYAHHVGLSLTRKNTKPQMAGASTGAAEPPAPSWDDE